MDDRIGGGRRLREGFTRATTDDSHHLIAAEIREALTEILPDKTVGAGHEHAHGQQLLTPGGRS
jgi:hypothetical protein